MEHVAMKAGAAPTALRNCCPDYKQYCLMADIPSLGIPQQELVFIFHPAHFGLTCLIDFVKLNGLMLVLHAGIIYAWKWLGGVV